MREREKEDFYKYARDQGLDVEKMYITGHGFRMRMSRDGGRTHDVSFRDLDELRMRVRSIEW